VKRYLLIALPMLCIAVAAILILSPLTRVAITRSKGKIDEGRFLDVEIGSMSAAAHKALTDRGFRHIERTQGGNCMGIFYEANFEVNLYFDDSWRRGTICVASIDGRVRSVRWYYDFLDP